MIKFLLKLFETKHNGFSSPENLPSIPKPNVKPSGQGISNCCHVACCEKKSHRNSKGM